MREILFRGKKSVGNEWIEGWLVKDTDFYGEPVNTTYIIDHKHPSACFPHDIYHEVIPETIGQYTGLKDRNGKKIFEGDIVKWEPYEEAVVEFDEGGFCANGHFLQAGICFGNFEGYVIGNIHDELGLSEEPE